MSSIAIALQTIDPDDNGNLICNKSKVKLTATATLDAGVTFQSFVINCYWFDPTANYWDLTGLGLDNSGIVSSNPCVSTSAEITKAGKWRVTYQLVTSGDSMIFRSIEFVVKEADIPKVARFEATRATSAGAVNAQGEYAKIIYNYTVDASNSNTATITFQSREMGATSWSTLKTLTALTGNSSFVTTAQYDTLKSYEFRIVIQDAYNTSVVRMCEMGPGTKLITGDGRSICFGGVSDYDGSAQFKMPTKIENSLTLSNSAKTAIVNIIYPVGSVVQLQDGKDPATLFGGTWVKHNVCWVAAMAPTKGMVTSWASYDNDTAVVLYELSTTANDSWQMKLKKDLTVGTFVAVNTWLRTA